MTAPKSKQGAIAVVGMGSVFPGAQSPEELWQNVLAGRRHFRKAPAGRMPADYFHPDPHTPDRSYCDLMAVITGWTFDPAEYRIAPVAAESSDITHWLALSTASAAIRDSGIDLTAVDGARAGVILGNTLAGEFSRSHYLRLRWPYVARSLRQTLLAEGLEEPRIERILAGMQAVYKAPLPESTEDTLAGNMSNTIAGRISAFFDFGGGSYTLDGACSSSLLAVHHACNALLQGDLDLVLAGGVDVSLDPFEIIGFAKTQALARDDIRPYDARAAGMLTGEGCGILVLAREDRARERGWRIRACIRGWGISSDGRGAVTAPQTEGQYRALRNAYTRAGYPISTVKLIEGHGTGTAVGDRVEIAVLRRALEEAGETAPCWLGSIKGNIGHCKAAAGAAGLIKAVMALERKVLPPTVNCAAPSPSFGEPPTMLRPVVRGRAWKAGNSPRRAGISSMGFGGANAHVTIEEADPDGKPNADDLQALTSAQPSELLVFAADDPAELGRRIASAATLLRRLCQAELTDFSAALARQNPSGRCRVALVAGCPWTSAVTLAEIAAGLEEGTAPAVFNAPDRGVFAGEAKAEPRWVALFPGQGSQRLNMGQWAFDRFPFVRPLLSAPGAAAGLVFREEATASPTTLQEWQSALRDTRHAQPGVTLCSLAVLRVLACFGLRPAMAIGHSVGEISALHCAGAFDERTALQIASQRGRAIGDLPLNDPGGMLAIGAGAADVERLLAEVARAEPTHLRIANYNAPRQTVVSGTTAAVLRAQEACAMNGIRCVRLAVSHAFHSALVAPAAEVLRRSLEQVSMNPLEGRVISTATGRELTPDTDLRTLLTAHVAGPVRFAQAVATAASERPDLWVEGGPGGVLAHLVEDILGPEAATTRATDLPGRNGYDLLNELLAQAYVLGFPVRLDALFAHRFHRPFDAEHYEPGFIVNPCERGAPERVGICATEPDAARSDQVPEKEPRAPANGGPVRETPTENSLLAFAVAWIARRAGFSTAQVRKEQRLRDDLGLDSIKAGELVLQLSQEAGRPFVGDPASLANSRLSEVVGTILKPPGAIEEPAASAFGNRIATGRPGGKGWVRTFGISLRPDPVGMGQPAPLPREGTFGVIAPASCPMAATFARTLSRRGLRVFQADWTEIAQPAADLLGLVLFLPAVTRAFHECGAVALRDRVEGTLGPLVRWLRWLGHGQERQWSGLKLLVVRRGIPPEAREGTAPEPRDPDLDAGAGLLKSLRLEHPGAAPKWIVLPPDWSEVRVAEVLLRECQTRSDRVLFRYDEDGTRFVETARVLPAEALEAPPVGPDDVVLVSGGAKGITAEIALALGRRTGVKLALLGSSAPAAETEVGEVAANLKRFAEAGLTARYFRCDVTDQEAVKSTVTKVERELGPVSGILHGAGVSRLNLFRDKSTEEFMACVRVKAAGLHHLLRAVDPARLRMVHAIASVLGHTGMQGQTDYATANAWLDGAIAALKRAHPEIHCLTMGYSVWGETGLGRKLGAVARLAVQGVQPLSTEEGVAAYLNALTRRNRRTSLVVTGPLDPALEAELYPPPPPFEWRYLERVRQWTPGVELIAETELDHDRDPYLSEHVYAGTPLFPGVMAIEAMVQGAAACLQTDDPPVLREIRFARPLVVPADGSRVIRIQALADEPGPGAHCVRVEVRSELDGFRAAHFAAECWFGLPAPDAGEPGPTRPSAAPLAVDPESLWPSPLFQGKFFRRIARVLTRNREQECCTLIEPVKNERYFGAPLPGRLRTGHPVIRDSCLQTGALILPPGCLPTRIAELRPGRSDDAPEATLNCRAVVTATSGRTYTADCTLRDATGRVVEQMLGIGLELPAAAVPKPGQPPAPGTLDTVGPELDALLEGCPQAWHWLREGDVNQATELAPVDRTRIADAAAPARRQAVLAHLVAVRRALPVLSRQVAARLPAPENVTLVHDPDGRPRLLSTGPEAFPAGPEIDVSLADTGDLSVAWLVQGAGGVDIECVSRRNAEVWTGLLGATGYRLARRIGEATHEGFDVCATRVWTMLEALKKAFPSAPLPTTLVARGGSWLSGMGGEDHEGLQVLSSVIEHGGFQYCLAFALRSGGRKPADRAMPPAGSGLEGAFEAILTDFRRGLRELQPRVAGDPEAPGFDERHAGFLRLGERTAARLFELEETVTSTAVADLRRRFQGSLIEFLDGSENFRHTLVKPLGYAGDFRLLDMLVRNRPQSRGLARHFDRWQLEHPASQACRDRIAWVQSEIERRLGREPERCWVVLDLGIGSGMIERRLWAAHPDVTIELLAVDREPAALAFVTEAGSRAGRRVQVQALDLRRHPDLAALEQLVGKADFCIAVGLLEALTDTEAARLLSGMLANLAPGAMLLTENFCPDHTTRPFMEWFMDFRLCYRSQRELRELLLQAGALPGSLRVRMDDTQSLARVAYITPPERRKNRSETLLLKASRNPASAPPRA